MADTPQTAPDQPVHRAGDPADLVRRVVEEACNQGHIALLDVLLPALGVAGMAAGPAWSQLPALLAAFRAAVPDACWSIVEQVSEGATVVTRLEVAGTFSGPLLGLAPPGRRATLRGVAISRFAGGCLVDLWLQADLLGLLEQLGVLPPLGLGQAAAMARVRLVGAALAQDRAPPMDMARSGTPSAASGGRGCPRGATRKRPIPKTVLPVHGGE